MVKEDIINLALKMFNEKGYAGTSMEDIAKGLGVKTPSLYYHINSKQELLVEIINRATSKYIKGMMEILLSNDSPRVKLEKVIYQHARDIMNDVEMAGVLFDERKALNPEQKRVIDKFIDNYQDLFKGIVREGIKDGYIVDIDVDLLAILVLGASSWIYKWYTPGKNLTPEMIASAICRMVTRGIFTDNGKETKP